MGLKTILLTSLLASQPLHAALTAEQWQSDLRELVEKIETIHPEPYAHYAREDFYRQVEAIHEAIPGLNPVDIQIRMMKLVSLLRDRHTVLFPLDPGGFNHWLPLYFYKFSDGFYVTSATKPYTALFGKKILRFNDTPAEDVFEITADLHSSDNDYGRQQNSYYMSSMDVLAHYGIANGITAIELTVEGEDGQPVAYTVEAVEIPFNLHESKSWGEMYGPNDDALFPSLHMPYRKLNVEQWLRAPLADKADMPAFMRSRSGYWYEYLDDAQTLYLSYDYSTHAGRNGFDSFQAFVDEAFAVADTRPVEKFILDIRYNPGGDGSTTLPLVHEFIKRDAINQKGRLFVLVGRKTYSAAQMIYAAMLEHTNTLLVGEPPGAPVNGYGDPGTYHLTESGMLLYISTLYWQLGHPADDSWLQPIDLPFVFSGADYVQGKDRAMEFLLALEAPWQSLPEVLRNGTAGEYRKEAQRREQLFGQYDWWKPFDERDMRFAARELYDAGEHDKGELGFQALVKQYPNEWRAWRDYADRVLKTGDTEKARSLVEQGLALHPGSADLLALQQQLADK